jgi:WD40 repeat protein
MQSIDAPQSQSPIPERNTPTRSFITTFLKEGWRLVLSWIDFPFRFLFGRDLFISYSRRDSRKYAPNLALALQKRRPKLSFYLDRWIAPPSGKLPISLKLQLRWSSIMVVICTENAIGSNFVKDEVARFAVLGRKVLTVDVDGAFNAVRGQEPWVGFSGADPEEESSHAILSGDPSDNVVERILKMVEFTTQDRRLRRAVWGTLVFVALSVGGTAAFSFFTVRAANDQKVLAEQQARAAEREAKDAEIRALDAANREAGAKEAQGIAERLAKDAAIRADAAEGLRTSAEAKASQALQKERNARAEAARQQNIATAGRIAAENILVPEPILEQVEKKVLFTIESMRRAQSSTAYRNLIEGIKMMPAAIDKATHKGPVKNVIFTQDGKFMVTVADGAVWLISTERLSSEGRLGPPLKISGDDLIKTVELSRNGKYLAAVGANAVYLWQTERMTELQPIQQKGVNAIAFSPDGELIVAGGDKPNPKAETVQKTTSVWRIGESLHSEIASVSSLDAVVDVSISPDKLKFTTLSTDGLLTWKTSDGPQQLKEPKRVDDPDQLRTGGFSPNGKYFFRTDVFDRTYGKVIRADGLKGGLSHQLDFVRFSPDGRFLATSRSDDERADFRETRVWDSYSDELTELSRINYASIIINGEFSNDGRQVALVSLENSSAEIWDTLSGRLLTYIKLADERGALAFSPDSKYFAAASANTVTIWPLSRDWKEGEINHLESSAVAVSPNGKLVGFADGITVKILNATDGREVSSIDTRCEIAALAYDWQNARIATAGNACGVWIWKIDRSSNGVLIQSKGAGSIAFSSNGRNLVVANDDVVSIYQIGSSARPVQTKTREGSFLAISGDGRRIATALNENVVAVWDTRSSKLPPLHVEHPMIFSDTNFTTAAFIDNTRIVTADNKQVRIWDITGTKPFVIGRVELPNNAPLGISHPVLSPNGAFVAKVAYIKSDQVRTTVWGLQVDALIATSCRRLSTMLDRTEWADAFGAEPYQETCSGLRLPVPNKD